MTIAERSPDTELITGWFLRTEPKKKYSWGEGNIKTKEVLGPIKITRKNLKKYRWFGLG